MRSLLKLCGVAVAITLPTAQAHAERIFGLTSGNNIVTFDSSKPGTVTSSGSIAGLDGATLTGIDLRPANRQLYSVATNGNVYAIAKNASGANYTASLVGNTMTSAAGARYGIDFNPVPDRLRFVTDFDRNLRINPTNGVTIVDGAVNGPGSIALVGAAYTNSRPGATATVLYALDASGNQLLRSTNPNGGSYVDTNLAGVTFANLGVDLGGLNNTGFDISGATGNAFFNVGDRFYTTSLTSGGSSLVGTIGGGSLVGLTAAAVPEPATWALMIGGFGLVGMSLRRRTSPTVAA